VKFKGKTFVFPYRPGDGVAAYFCDYPTKQILGLVFQD